MILEQELQKNCDLSSGVVCLEKMEIFFSRIPRVVLRLLNYSPSGLWLLRAESSREKTCGPPGWSGSQEISPHQADAQGSGEILNRAPGNNSTLDNLSSSPGLLVPIVKSDRAPHNPPPQHRWAGTRPLTSRWNASESLQHRPQIPS